ncbi:hypothetical protein HPB49_006856 [Dermacentor silvarum]|uniref:Uncharacterized protein n=1 Tax=Dermacentor silvarum TaxID=543639 RepID=A0ACB8DWC9_DERSI|nr:hypothetical protein HPB49_006856 [Dermacentor silvarum]
MTENFAELIARLTMQNLPGVAGNTTEGAASKPGSKDCILATPETTIQSSNSINHFSTKGLDVELDVEHETNVIADDEVIVNEEPEWKAPTESDVENIVCQLRELLHEKGPSKEDDLMEALSPLQAQLMLQAYGTPSAFQDRRQEFHVVHEDLHSFIYYKEPDNEADRVC